MQNSKKILVAKLRHHGDVLLSSPVFTLLKKHYPSASIDAYLYKETYPMLEEHPAIDGFILYDKKKKSPLKKLFYEMKILWTIRRKKYDLVINLTEGDRGALAAKISKAPFRVGFDPENAGMKGKKEFYTHIARHCHGIRHTVERNLDVLRAIGIFPKEEERELTFVISKKEEDLIQALLEENEIDPANFFLVHPVSRWLFKCLPEETMASIVSYLASLGGKVILTASNDEKEKAMNEKIAKLANSKNVVDFSGKVSLKGLGALIKKANLLVCVDSVPLHLASALKSPVLALFGPTSEKNWAPWKNPYARVFVKNHPCRPCYMPGCGGCGISDCLESMTASEVIKEIESLLQTLPLRRAFATV